MHRLPLIFSSVLLVGHQGFPSQLKEPSEVNAEEVWGCLLACSSEQFVPWLLTMKKNAVLIPASRVRIHMQLCGPQNTILKRSALPRGQNSVKTTKVSFESCLVK